MNTYKVTFNKFPTFKDRLYTYKSEDDLVPGQTVFIETPGRIIKQVIVMSKDDVFDVAAEKRFGKLGILHIENPSLLVTKKGVSHL